MANPVGIDNFKFVDTWRNWVSRVAGTIATIAALATVICLLKDPPKKPASTPSATSQSSAQATQPAADESTVHWFYVAIVLWAVVPPVYFWFEHFFVWRGGGVPQSFDLHKYGQDVSRNIWLAFVALLLALYFK